MNVALVLCPQWDADWATYGPALLSAQLRRRGHTPRFYDLNQSLRSAFADPAAASRFDPSSLVANPWSDRSLLEDALSASERRLLAQQLDRVLSFSPRIVAFSAYFFNTAMTLQFARWIKERDESIMTVVGGPSCLDFSGARAMVQNESVDVVVFGEADRAFPDLVDEVERRGRPPRAAGILLRDDPATWDESRQEMESLDELPYADYSDYPVAAYRGKVVNTHRGCVRQCTFCSEWSAMSYRRMSPRRVLDEFHYQLERHPDSRCFMFGDSLVNSSMKDLEQICELLIESRIAIGWGCYAITRKEMTGAVLEKMRRAGCAGLFYGIESGSDRLLREVSKNTTAALNARVLRETRQAGLETHVGWIVGLPGESDEDFRESLAFLRRCAGDISLLNINFALLTGEMGSPDFLRRRGIAYHPIFWRARDGSNTFPIRASRALTTLRTCQEHGIPFVLTGGTLSQGQAEQRVHDLLQACVKWQTAAELMTAGRDRP